MKHGIFEVPTPVNEPVRDYAPGSAERASVEAHLHEMHGNQVEIPVVIGGEKVHTGQTADCVEPHDHHHKLGQYHKAGTAEVEQAIAASREAWKDWSETPFETRAAIFLRAADLLAGPWRDTLNASTMLGQSKTVFQAEIDAACEMADFLRYNVAFAEQIYQDQPRSSAGMWNRVEYRALEGFVFAVTPFNFTSIAGNLPSAPAIMGNTVLWKPASSSVYSGHFMMELFREAGVPDGVINFVPGSGAKVGDPVMASEHFAGLHFTGSTQVFNGLWSTISNNLEKYGRYPRIVGETGGKDFVFAHPSADRDELVTALIRGAFEFQGQKCSAASRAFIPRSIWNEVRDQLVETVRTIKMGDPKDFSNFMCAVIDKAAFDSISSYVHEARDASDAQILVGGECDDSHGYFIQPTVIETTNPKFRSLCEEIFGPVLTVMVYDDDKLDEALTLCDTGSSYALTGAVFGRDRIAIDRIADRLRHTAGNFYINDKPTGAVVGQQPFGGGRASGTNDKAGSWLNMIRWCSPRTMKETFVPATEYRYPHMG